MNPNLPGLAAPKQVTLAEKLHSVRDVAMGYCWGKCITHFGEDSLPYHPGEKTCIDRCFNKVYDGVGMAKEAKARVEETARERPGEWKWMMDLDELYKNSPPKL